MMLVSKKSSAWFSLALLVLLTPSSTRAGHAVRRHDNDVPGRDRTATTKQPRTRLLRWLGGDEELAAAQRLREAETIRNHKKMSILRDVAIDHRTVDDVDHYRDLMRRVSVEREETRHVVDDTGLRRLAGHCAAEDLLVGNCTIQEYCEVLNGNVTEADISCTGDFEEGWTLTTAIPEFCFYISQAGLLGLILPLPYDADSFDPVVDYCIQSTLSVDSVRFNNTGETESYTITRGGSGSYSKTSVYTPCNDTDLDNGGGGECLECEGAFFDGVMCASCSSCPQDSAGPDTALDCSNVYPDFVQTCDDDDDSVFLGLVVASGALCTFQGWLEVACSAESLCAVLDALETDPFLEDDVPSPTKTCSLTGSPDGDWMLQLDYSEDCWYNSTGGELRPFNETVFDPSQDYCFVESEQVKGTGTQVTEEGYVFTTTMPCEITLTASYPACAVEGRRRRKLQNETVGGGDDFFTDDPFVDDEYEDDDDTIFFPAGCTEECPVVTIGGRPCTSECKTCPGSGEILGTCSNLASDLEETCDSGFPDTALDYALLAYCEANPPTEPPTTAPVAAEPTAAPSTMAPADEGSRGDPANESSASCVHPIIAMTMVVIAVNVAMVGASPS